MLFAIRRASWYGADDGKNSPPCRKAEFYSKAVPERMLESGFKIPAHVDTKWTINIESLEDLLAIMKEVEEDLIISEERIIIYDTYVE